MSGFDPSSKNDPGDGAPPAEDAPPGEAPAEQVTGSVPFAGAGAPGPTMLEAPISAALRGSPDGAPEGEVPPAGIGDAAPAVAPEAGSEQAPLEGVTAPPATRVTFRERLRRLGGRLARVPLGVEEYIVSMATAFTSWVPWLFALGLALGGGVWSLVHRKSWSELFENKLAMQVRLWMVPWLGGGVLLVTAFVGVMHLLARRREKVPFSVSARHWGRRLLPVFILPIAASFLAPEMRKESGATPLLHCAFGAFTVLISAYAWLSPRPSAKTEQAPAEQATLGQGAPAVSPTLADEPAPPVKKPGGLLGRVLAAIWVFLLWMGHTALFSYFALVQHFSLATRTIDLGYYDNIFYQSIHGRWLACSFLKTGNHASAHFDPILVVLSPLYLIYPRAELLLVLQSLWIGSGVIPTYLIAQRRLGSRLSAGAIALAYILHPGLHGANMYEFHSLSLVAPVFLWVIFFLEKGSLIGYYISLAVLLLCREDAALLSFCVGVATIIAPYALTAKEDSDPSDTLAKEKGAKRRRRMGVVTALVSVSYFVLVKLVFMSSPDILNSGKDAYSFAYYYDDLIPKGSGVGGLFLSLTENPMFVLRHVFTEPKIIYFVTVFLPIGFLPFLVRPARWILAYGLFFCLLASRTAVFSTHFQYVTLLYPSAIAFTPAALAAIGRRPAGFFGSIDMGRLSRALVPAVVVATMLVSWQFGAIVPNGRFKGGFQPLRRVLTEKDKDTYAWVRNTLKQVPANARVSVTDRTGAHVSNRRYAFFYPAHTDVDFVFIDEGDLRGHDQNKHKKILAKGIFKEVARQGKIVLYKKSK